MKHSLKCQADPEGSREKRHTVYEGHKGTLKACYRGTGQSSVVGVFGSAEHGKRDKNRHCAQR